MDEVAALRFDALFALMMGRVIALEEARPVLRLLSVVGCANYLVFAIIGAPVIHSEQDTTVQHELCVPVYVACLSVMGTRYVHV